MTTFSFSLDLRKTDTGDIQRRFGDESVGGTLGNFLQELWLTKEPEVVAAVRENYPQHPELPEMMGIHIFGDERSIFLEYRNVPWYLDVIGRMLMRLNNPCSATIKACSGYLFFDLYKTTTANPPTRHRLIPPFFHSPPPPPGANPEEVQNANEHLLDSLRGLADTVLLIAPAMLRANAGEYSDLFRWFELHWEIVPHQRADGLRLDITSELTWDSSPLAESRKSISYYWPPNRKEPQRLLVASENTRLAVSDLAEAWHNPTARSILLSAWTGSGKEEFAKLLGYAMGLNNEQHLIKIAAPDLSNLDGVENRIQRQVCAELSTQPAGTRASTQGLGGPGVLHENWGERKLELAQTPAILFIDEIHHEAAAPVRPALLRFMESWELRHEDKKVDCSGLLTLLAASRPPIELRRLGPPDFWTRIDYTVFIKHPLLLEDRDEKHAVLQHYFALFWRDAEKKRQRTLSVDQTGEEIKPILDVLVTDALLHDLSDRFAKVLDSPFVPVLSIRILRSIVGRLFSRAVYFARTHYSLVLGSPVLLRRKLEDQIDKWVAQMINEVKDLLEIDARQAF